MLVNQFSEILDSGYFSSEEIKNLLSKLSGIEINDPERQNKIDELFELYPYEYRFAIIMDFINFCLDDNLISEIETRTIKLLKTAFEIIPGDFYKFHRDFIMRIIQLQYHLYKLDDVIDFEESSEIQYLQDIFDINEEQLSEFILLEDKE